MSLRPLRAVVDDRNVTAHTGTINQNTFNTYGVDWTPTSITIIYNGTTGLVDHPTTGCRPFDQPFSSR
jgi:hypothetical protein